MIVTLPELLLRGVDYSGEVSGLEGRAADESAVDVDLREKLSCVLCVHRAAVLNGECLSRLSAVEFRDDAADDSADLVSLLGSSGLAGSD